MLAKLQIFIADLIISYDLVATSRKVEGYVDITDFRHFMSLGCFKY